MFLKIVLLAALVSISWSKVVVTTTIYPIFSIVKEVGGNAIELHNFIPFGAEVHDFEPTPQQMVTLSKSDLFLYSSNILEPWAKKIIEAANIKNRAYNLSQEINLYKEDDSGFDPHYWVSLENYITMIQEVKMILVKQDPSNKELYSSNAAKYTAKVEDVKKSYDTGLKSCQNRKILVNHDAFGYMAREYNIDQLSINGMSPDEQPSSKQIAKLIEMVKKDKINTVFFEEFASDKVAKVIAKEADVKTTSLNPAENLTQEEYDQGYDYLDIMRDNLKKLKEAMVCR